MEIARWGDVTKPNLNYTVWPAVTGFSSTSKKVPFSLTGTYTTHRFAWENEGVFFQTLHGHRDDNVNEFANWSYYPTDYTNRIPQNPLPVRLNLWLFHGNAPSNGQGVEVVIKKFSFTPQ